MSFEKFNQHNEGKYWERYFEKDREFYDAIKEHMAISLGGSESVGIDIGTGPGVGAKILDQLKLKTTLTGYEPSELSSDNTNLAKELKAKNSSVDYRPVSGGIEDIPTPKEELWDYILALRSAHEIAKSLGSKDRFFSELSRVLAGLKEQGKLIMADLQYSDSLLGRSEIIEATREYKEKIIGHSEVPSNLISDTAMEERLKELGMKLVKTTMVPDKQLLNHLKESGFDIEESPCCFYVQTYQK